MEVVVESRLLLCQRLLTPTREDSHGHGPNATNDCGKVRVDSRVSSYSNPGGGRQDRHIGSILFGIARRIAFE